MTEIWKSLKNIVECGDYYEISNLGRLKSTGQRKTILKLHKNEKGYFRVKLYCKGKTKTYRLHRLVALAFVDNPEEKPEVNHKDGDKENNYATNLEWSTRKENVVHSFDNGLNKTRGEGNHHAKINEDKVRDIRRMYDSKKYTQLELSKLFGISRPNVSSIVRRESWKHVE